VNCNEETIDHERYESLDATPVSFEEALQHNWNKVLYLFSNKQEKRKQAIFACGRLPQCHHFSW
ncbi:MAG: hypothetical protein II277_04020, partial [Bacteroidales bacterium]|nr:hypothetical protein [Bacteroidales bacterium]